VTMRIGIDARELSGRATGVGRYLGGLLREWAADSRARSHDFVLYAPEPIGMPLDTRRFATRTIPGAGGTWWEQVQLQRAVAADHLDLFFAPAYTAPLRLTIPSVVAIHDVSFAAHPEWFRPREGARRRWVTKASARRATSVITISHFSRRELIERLDVPADKIHVIPPGIGAGSREPGPGRATCSVSSASAQPPASSPCRVLFVGSIFNRRRVIDLIRAFAPIARSQPGAMLDIVGDNRSYPHEDVQRTIDGEQLRAQVRWHEYVRDEELAALYAGAHVFAFLSEYEGLGLTPLEALAAGIPPVLLDTPVARESCGDAAVYVPVNDLSAATRALESLLFDDAIRRRVLAAAPGQLAKYSWPRAARDTMAVLERAGLAPSPGSGFGEPGRSSTEDPPSGGGMGNTR
jgi:glycosyltransferase involved in cell wall biosynthesis